MSFSGRRQVRNRSMETDFVNKKLSASNLQGKKLQEMKSDLFLIVIDWYDALFLANLRAKSLKVI